MFLGYFVKPKTAYDLRISDWSSDVCSSDLPEPDDREQQCRRMQSLPAGLADRAAGDRRFRGHGCGGGDGGRLGHAKSVWIWRRIVSRIAAARSARSPGSVTVLLWVPDVWTIRWDRQIGRAHV